MKMKSFLFVSLQGQQTLIMMTKDFEPIMEQQIHQDDFGESECNLFETFCDLTFLSGLIIFLHSNIMSWPRGTVKLELPFIKRLIAHLL